MSRDTREFTQLFEPYYNDALRYVRALCSNWSPDEAEDVLQQSFLRALENFGSLNDVSKFKSWFFKIITREFYSSVRKHFWKKFLPMDSLPEVLQMPAVFSSNDKDDIDTEMLNYCLSKLGTKERAALLLFELAGFSIEEIAELQEEKSLSAVKSRLSRARAKLRKHLSAGEIKPVNSLNGNFTGDLEYETIRLINEIRTEK